MNKNGRLVSVMDTCESIFGDVDSLVKKVNEVNEKGLDLSGPADGSGGSGDRVYSRSNSGGSYRSG